MKHSSRTPFVASLSFLLAVAPALCAGCATTSGGDAGAPTIAREVTRNDAITHAREDAKHSYGSDWGSQVDARYSAGFWVIDLYATTGYHLRYAISARDGSIRERNMLQ